MSQIHSEASAVIDGQPEEIYAILVDYHKGHAAILPKPYFTELTVKTGGTGAGTIIRVGMKVMGVERTYHMEVTEPEPGRVLVEADEKAGVTTTFTLDPINDGRQTRVTIVTDAEASPGFTGFMEKLVNPPIARHIYKRELQQLADYVRSKQVSGGGAD